MKNTELLSVNSLDSYIRSVNAIPMLSQEMEVYLATRLREYGDLEAARQMVMSHLRLVVKITRDYAGYGLPQADLIQEGNIGLMKAVKSYDLSFGARLSTFAIHWIKAEINEYVVRNYRMVKIATTKPQRKLFFNLRKMLGMDKLTPEKTTEIANKLNVSTNDVIQMNNRFSGKEITIEMDEEDTYSPICYLHNENDDPSIIVEQSQAGVDQSEKLIEGLNKLDTRSRYILQRRWMDEDKATLQDLSKELGVSMERVRQIEKVAMEKIKVFLS